MGKVTYDKRTVSLLETSVHVSPCSFGVKSVMDLQGYLPCFNFPNFKTPSKHKGFHRHDVDLDYLPAVLYLPFLVANGSMLLTDPSFSRVSFLMGSSRRISFHPSTPFWEHLPHFITHLPDSLWSFLGNFSFLLNS